MAIYSYDRYTSTGQASFAITFDYLSSTHIEIYLNGVLQTTGYSLDTGTNQVTFDPIPGSGTVVLVQRATPKTKADYQAQIADFANGSVLTETDLDNAVLGLLYITQEAEDSGATNALGKDLTDEVWDAGDTRIKDLAAPTAPLDAVTKQYVDSLALYNDAVSVPQTWTFSGTGSVTAFTLADPAPVGTDVNMYVIDVAGVMQKPTTDFTIVGTTLTFESSPAPASGTDNITVRNFGVARDIIASPIQPSSTSTVGMTIKGLSGQDANLQNWTDSADAVKASIDKDGDISTAGTLSVTGATTLTGGVTGAMAATGAVSGTTITGSAGITGTTGTFSSDVGVTGDLNLVAGALQYAGVDAMSIRQIVEHDYAQPSGWTTYYKALNGDGTTFYNVNISLSITPKVTGSTLLLYCSTRMDFGDNNGTSSSKRYAWTAFYLGNTSTTVNTAATGGEVIYAALNGESRPTGSTGSAFYGRPSLWFKHTAGTAGVAMDFDLVVKPHANSTATTYWTSDVAEVDNAQFFIIEIA